MKVLAALALGFVVMVPAVQAQRPQRPQQQRPAPAARTAQVQQRLQPRDATGGNRPRAAAAAANPNSSDDLLLALYINEFQRQVGVSDADLKNKFRPVLMRWLQQRRNVVNRRNDAVMTLRQLLASGAPASEITRQIQEVDQAENQTRNAERRLLNEIDPLLTPVQQGKFRVFQVDMEQRLKDLLETARAGRGR
ncbi:MAG TPA: hypothetical protein VFY29_03840 [Terriglobia bacterium]|nr:hypothetical protein [Terriglobia bacterium]